MILGFVSDLNGVEGTGFSIFSTLQPCPVTGFVYELVGTVSKNTQSTVSCFIKLGPELDVLNNISTVL